MGYYVSTVTSISVRVPDLELDTATTAMVSASIDDAEAEVNKYLSRRYDMSPFQTTTASIPPLMRTLSIRLTEAYVWQRNSRGAKESLKRGDNLEKSVIENLIALSTYVANLTDTAGSLIPSDANNGAFRVLSNTVDFRDTFNEGKSSQWHVDRDKLEAIDDGDF